MDHDELAYDFSDDLIGLDDDTLADLMIDEIVTGVENDYETDLDESARSVRLRQRHRMLSLERQENLSEVLTELPGPGDSIHMLGCNRFDAWTFVPVCLELMGGRTDELYIATWLITHKNVRELVELLDAGKIPTVSVMTGLLFKRRLPDAYALLIDALIGKGKGRYFQAPNHAKIMLLCDEAAEKHLVIETSANMSHNKNLEFTVVHNSRELYGFYRGEFESIFDRGVAKW